MARSVLIYELNELKLTIGPTFLSIFQTALLSELIEHTVVGVKSITSVSGDYNSELQVLKYLLAYSEAFSIQSNLVQVRFIP